MSVPSQLYRYSGVGLKYSATLGVFAFAGYWADGKLGTSPWLLLAGVFLGFGLGTYSLVLDLSRSDAPESSGSAADPSPNPRDPTS